MIGLPLIVEIAATLGGKVNHDSRLGFIIGFELHDMLSTAERT
jgi:hypothetical protein